MKRIHRIGTIPGDGIGKEVISEGVKCLSALSMPLFRWRMGDMVKVDDRKCDCGRTFLRLDGGVIGRVDVKARLGGSFASEGVTAEPYF